MRELAVRLLRTAPTEYSDAVLGLLQPKTWGSGVELALFAAHFRTEIWCWNVKHGVHYDVVEQERKGPAGPERITAFECSAAPKLRAACERLVRELQQQH
ncbi:hypothetical protein MBRA1_000487 [Malassezia brasiliensis]|uniref:Uncharacterized protein n=1 Tax=Malassezia brasiliensis TaxID=1821822 RepID=A0AAF0DR21_9BASI|nr:hypothetical protein MBRA1_000487 [Malassezia brasiliensis]